MRTLIIILSLIPALCMGQTSGKVVNGTITVTEDSGTPQQLTGQSTLGEFHGIVIGNGLAVSNDTLNKTGASGDSIIIADIIPDYLLGFNLARDTFTEIKIPAQEPPGLAGGVNEIHDVFLYGSDTLGAKSSHLVQSDWSFAATINMGPGASDSIRLQYNSINVDGFEFYPGWGVRTEQCDAWELATLYPGFETQKLYRAQFDVSVSSDSIVDAAIYIYVDGVRKGECAAEFSLLAPGNRSTVTGTCLLLLDCNSQHKVQLYLENQDPVTPSIPFTFERVALSLYHIKSLLIETGGE